MQVNNKWYDRLKLFVMVVCPGLATAYLGLDALWDLPKENEVAGTIAVVATFLGLFLRKAASDYDGAGDLVLHKDMQDGQVYQSVDWNEHPDTLKNGQNITLNVRREDIS